jgi:hypothetical protein
MPEMPEIQRECRWGISGISGILAEGNERGEPCIAKGGGWPMPECFPNFSVV